MDNILTFTIPQIPPNYSKSLKINWSFRTTYLSQEAVRFKNFVKECMPNWEVDKDSLFEITICIHNDWYFKNKKVKKQDIQNLDRLVIDACMEKVGVDDSHIFKCHYVKVQSAKRRITNVMLRVIEKEEKEV